MTRQGGSCLKMTPVCGVRSRACGPAKGHEIKTDFSPRLSSRRNAMLEFGDRFLTLYSLLKNKNSRFSFVEMTKNFQSLRIWVMEDQLPNVWRVFAGHHLQSSGDSTTGQGSTHHRRG